MKKGLVSYRRNDDEDESDTPSSTLVSKPAIASSSQSTNSTSQPDKGNEQPSRPETADTRRQMTEKGQSSAPILIEAPVGSKQVQEVFDVDGKSIKRKKIDYSSWNPTPRQVEANEGIARFVAWSSSGQSINANLRNSKEFHNPSLLTSLVEMCGIDEHGTNIPVEKRGLRFAVSDRHTALIAAQDAQIAARSAAQQPGKRTHIDFVSRRSPHEPYQGAPDAKRFKR